MRGNAPGLLLAVATPALLAGAARAETTIPRPNRFVVDTAGVIDDGVERQLEALLAELSQTTTANVIVLTVADTDGEDFFAFVQRHADLWRPGRKDKDNGCIIALTVAGRQVRIQTGYGVESVLPDSWCGTASREVAAGYFKHGRYADGLSALTAQVAQRVADHAGVVLSRWSATAGRTSETVARTRGRAGDDVPAHMPPASHTRPGWVVCGGALVPLLIMIIVVSSMSRRNRYYRHWGGGGLLQGLFWAGVLSNMMGSGRRSSWGGGGLRGGGFGGGSFGGGFGGGGGGASW